MTFLKPCPFCNTVPAIEFDDKTGLYYIECKRCLSNNIHLKCENEDSIELAKIWNNRWFDNQLVLNKEEYLRFIDKYYYEQALKNNSITKNLAFEVREKDNIFNPTQQNSYGYLIFDNNEIVLCNMYDHQAFLMERYNIKKDKKDFDHVDFCAHNGIVRISISNSVLTVDIPFKVTEKQINSIFLVLLQFPYLKDILQFEVFYYKTNVYKVFYTLDELLTNLESGFTHGRFN